MQQYMITTSQIKDNIIELNDDDLHHIFNVMRMKKNDEIWCVDIVTETRYLCKIVNNEIVISENKSSNNELPNNLVLAFGLVKADKLEFVIQKACELGVSKFIPLDTKNSIVKYDINKLDKKMVRWQKIIKEACEQSLRNNIMEITMPKKISALKDELQDINLVAYEKADEQNKIRHNYCRGNDCLIVIGPEGGFDKTEIEELQQLGIKEVSLGKRILRCETAAISTVSIISDLME